MENNQEKINDKLATNRDWESKLDTQDIRTIQDQPDQIEDCRIADIASDNLQMDNSNHLSNMPYFPDHIFQSLPVLLKDSCMKFDNKRERDVYLISALCVLSGCFNTVTGIYGQCKVYPNLYSFIVAPAASGKGVMRFAKQLGMKIHNKLIEKSMESRKKYDLELKTYKSLLKKSNKDKIDLAIPDRPKEPALKVLFIPGDVSSSRLVDHLVANEETGIFFETEADTMAGILNQDWGGYSDKLRKAFHHEPIAYSRKGGSEFKEVECPRLSVVLTGTPSQVAGIIRSVSDGLFSRFAFYTFNGSIQWKSAFPKGASNLTEYFDGLADKVSGYAELANRSQIKFSLSEAQMNLLDKVCSAWLKESYILLGEDAKASAIRLGMILYRLAMTLSVLREAESQSINPELMCNDTDFNNAIAICQVLKEHLYTILRQMPKQADKKETKHKVFLNSLPDSKIFKRPKAVEIGKSLFLSPRTVDSYLKDLVQSGLLINPTGKPGFFQKVYEPTIPSLSTH
jgi:hypothetical protein